MSLRLTLVCHAATRATRDAAFPSDEPLEPLGMANAAALAESLGRVDAAWTSPALRSTQTAAALGLVATTDVALADIDLGHWAGRSLAEVAGADPIAFARWTEDVAAAPHGGESITDLLQRVSRWLEAMASSRGRCVAVTHAAVMRAAIVAVLESKPASFWRIDVEPLCFARFQARAGQWTFRSLGTRRSNAP